jgi:hypothetical protein
MAIFWVVAPCSLVEVYQFSVVSIPNVYILSNVDVYRLYNVLLRIHSLSEWDILMLGGQ